MCLSGYSSDLASAAGELQAQQRSPELAAGAGPAAASAATGLGTSGAGTQSGASGAAATSSVGGSASKEEPEAGQGGQLSAADYQRMLQDRGLDCRGWSLVVVGHSLGAAVAALASAHLRTWCPGVKVWSFNPPGGMVTANLSRALQRTVTSVVVGKDVVSRTGTITFERLLDQVGGWGWGGMPEATPSIARLHGRPACVWR